MALACCAAPFHTLKPNPSRSFLSAGRGDYPKGFRESESVTRALIQGKDQQAKDYQRDGTRLRNPNPRLVLRSSFMARRSYKPVTMQQHFGVIKLLFLTAQQP
jgi:hypothetical protein